MAIASLIPNWLARAWSLARPLRDGDAGRQVATLAQRGGSDDADHSARVQQYRYNEAMLGNTVYHRYPHGYRDAILINVLGFNSDDCADARLTGWFNPTRTIVDAYQNVFRGPFGREVKLNEKVGTRDVNPLLLDDEKADRESPVRQVWRWSNLDTAKQSIQEWAANLGTVVLRIKVTGNDARRRVMVEPLHPSYVRGFASDDRGNVTAAELCYPATTWAVGEGTRDVEVREVFTKARFLQEINGTKTTDEPNALGVCPIVILRHGDDGHDFGRWAYHGTEDIIHGLNWIKSNQAESINEHIWPTWFGGAAAKAPESVKVGRHSMSYVQLEPDGPSPFLQALVANLDHGGAIAFQELLRKELQQRQPEIVLGNVEALSGQSGETIAKLLTGVEAKIEQAKANYEHAMIRAIQIALSWGVMLSLWDLGSGMGNEAAADAAYDDGLEDFEFADRPALPQTVYDKLVQSQLTDAQQLSKFNLAKAAQGIGLPQEEVFKHAGFDDAKAKQMAAQKQKEAAAAQASIGGGTNLDPRVAKGMARIAARAGGK
jgi:hypothetical protein